MTDQQRKLIPDPPKPRKDWSMVEALGVLEWFLAEGERQGMTGAELDQWARNQTWERVEWPNGRPTE